MADARETPVVVFGKLSGTGLLLLGVAAIIAAGAYLSRSASTPAAPPQSVVAQPPAAFPEHSFQLVQLGEMRRDQFLYDKRTGRIWTSVCTGQVSGANCSGMLIWQEMYVDGTTPPTSPASLYYQLQTQSQKSK